MTTVTRRRRSVQFVEQRLRVQPPTLGLARGMHVHAVSIVTRPAPHAARERALFSVGRPDARTAFRTSRVATLAIARCVQCARVSLVRVVWCSSSTC